MKLFLAALTLTLTACGATKFGLSSAAAPTQAGECCAAECDPTITKLPSGNWLITCAGEGGASCEIELACSAGKCAIVRSECGACCSAGAEQPAR